VLQGYDPAGNHKLDVGVLGLKRMQEVLVEIAATEDKKDGSRRMIQDGAAMEAEGKELVPAIKRPAVFAYYRKLYKLAQTATTLDKLLHEQ
jgi:hypothetical protein